MSTTAPTAEIAALSVDETPKEKTALKPITATNIPCFNSTVNGCEKMGLKKLTCPTCQKMNTPNANFCSNECFTTNWKGHKAKFHPAKKVDSVQVETYAFPEGTHDPFRGKVSEDRRTGEKGAFSYTGPLRAVYPDTNVPIRVVPAHIKRPDYAGHCEALSSIPSKWESVPGGTVWGKLEEVARVISYGLMEPEISERRMNVIRKTKQQGKILNAKEIEGMRKVCRLAREVLDIAAASLRVGMTTLDIDEIVHRECVARESYPSPLNYRLFPRSVCTSVNEVICHGIPDARPLEDGDIINLDVTLYHGGFHGDVNATYPVGTKVSEENLKLISATRECLDEAIRACKPGALIKEFGNIITRVATKRGFTVNTTYVGHGINQLFHPTPNIPHYAKNNASGKLAAGMTFTIEPMICTAHCEDVHWPDDWTAVTTDGKPSAQFEETLLCTENGVEVLTGAPGWTLPPTKEDMVAVLEQPMEPEEKSTPAVKKPNKKRKSHIPNAFFCSSECFTANWKAHKAQFHHKKVLSDYVFPEGTMDPFGSRFYFDRKTGRKDIFSYTGPLRAVYPVKEVPKREVPAHIPRPDYAAHPRGESLSEISERRVARSKRTSGKVLNRQEIEGMRKVCQMSREVLEIAAAALKPGVTTLEIDEIVHRECVTRSAYPSPLGYMLFPRSVCTSINEVICHGIPDARPLEDGDIVNIDISMFYGGFHGDVNGTYPVGTQTSQQNLDLIAATRECLDESIRVCKPGALLQEFGNIITKVAHKRGFTVNATFVGHGINQLFHPTPDIPHYANNSQPGKLKAGMTFTIEPMICVGSFVDKHWPDNWTAATTDGKPSAQFEETILCTEDGFEVLTAAPGWTLPPMKDDLVPLLKGSDRAIAADPGTRKTLDKKRKQHVLG